jgi:hypothetical protein
VTTAAAPQVKIVRFSADPTSIQSGQTTTLVWEVLNADTVTISGIGNVDPKAGTSTVTLSQTTMFTLTAKNKSGEVNETLTVTVQRPEARILRFMAAPPAIASGEVSTLSWQTENATTVTISGIGSVQANASTTVSPTATTTYTLTASNQFGQVSATATVQVTQGPATLAPRILRFAATPVEILPSEQASLVWQVENATDVSITGIGNVDPTGTSTVSPADTTTYTITAKNGNGQVSATATVTVDKLVKILNFVANPSQVAKAGDAATLQWQTENATSAVITGVGSVPVNGSIVVHPSSDVSYTLIAYGRRSQVVALVILRVGAVGGTSTGGNQAPVADAGPDQPHAGADVTLDGSASHDPDGDPITCSWRVIAPPWASIANPNSCTTTANLASGLGDYVFELSVFDDKRATTSAFVTITYVGP